MTLTPTLSRFWMNSNSGGSALIFHDIFDAMKAFLLTVMKFASTSHWIHESRRRNVDDRTHGFGVIRMKSMISQPFAAGPTSLTDTTMIISFTDPRNEDTWGSFLGRLKCVFSIQIPCAIQGQIYQNSQHTLMMYNGKWP
jgi:hypothetical protein